MNRFRDPTMRAQYNAALKAFHSKHSDLFDEQGNRRSNGSSFADFFWRGYDNVVVGQGWTAQSRKMIGYAYWRAGYDTAQLKVQQSAVYDRALDAEVRCNQWLADGNAANERGNKAMAERCYARSQYWLDRYNKFTGKS